MDVLSLFDGISCGQIALNKANIPYTTYFASEIDKAAITGYTESISSGKRYKVLGNGWNVDTIVHILGFLNLEK